MEKYRGRIHMTTELLGDMLKLPKGVSIKEVLVNHENESVSIFIMSDQENKLLSAPVGEGAYALNVSDKHEQIYMESSYMEKCEFLAKVMEEEKRKLNEKQD